MMQNISKHTPNDVPRDDESIGSNSNSVLVRYLKIMVVVGIVVTVSVAIVKESNSSFLSYQGSYISRIGNRQLRITPPVGTRLTTQLDSVQYLSFVKNTGTIAFAILDDLEGAGDPVLIGTYFLETHPKELDTILAQFLSNRDVSVVEHELTPNRLLMKTSESSQIGDTVKYSLRRYDGCYPYYLTLIATWKSSMATPEAVIRAFDAVEVLR